MNNNINLSEMEEVMTEVLSHGSTVTLTASGTSMEPFIRNGKDTVVLKKIQKRLQKGDIILYKRGNGKLVLHRVVGENKNGYILCGDNQWIKEQGIKESQIIAVLDSIERNGRVIKSDGTYFKVYKVFLPLIKWVRRVKNSISIRLKGEHKK